MINGHTLKIHLVYVLIHAPPLAYTHHTPQSQYVRHHSQASPYVRLFPVQIHAPHNLHFGAPPSIHPSNHPSTTYASIKKKQKMYSEKNTPSPPFQRTKQTG